MIDSPKKLEASGPRGDPLQALISRDTCQEIVGAMTARELLIALCRIQRLPDEIPAYILGVSVPHLSVIMAHARLRLAADLPELAALLDGRHHLPLQDRALTPPPPNRPGPGRPPKYAF